LDRGERPSGAADPFELDPTLLELPFEGRQAARPHRQPETSRSRERFLENHDVGRRDQAPDRRQAVVRNVDLDFPEVEHDLDSGVLERRLRGRSVAADEPGGPELRSPEIADDRDGGPVEPGGVDRRENRLARRARRLPRVRGADGRSDPPGEADVRRVVEFPAEEGDALARRRFPVGAEREPEEPGGALADLAASVARGDAPGIRLRQGKPQSEASARS